MSSKLKKLLTVVFLTILIWWWAFTSLERDTTLFGSLEVSPSTSPDLYVTFNEEKTKMALKLTFRGAPLQVTDLERRNRAADTDPTRERLDFYYDPAEYGDTESGTYVIDTLELIKKSSKIRDLALTVEECDPANVEVTVQKLTPRELNVEVMDEAGASVPVESIEPPRVLMYVQEGYAGPARVILTARQIDNARIRPVRERPFITMGMADRRQYAGQTVQIRLPSTIPLKEQPPLQRVRIGFVMPAELLGSYTVELLNETDFRTMNIRATDEAMRLYEQRQYQILIQVLPGDQDLERVPLRPVLYNFPPEMVRRGLIEAPDPPDQASIRLVPVNPPPNP